MAENPVDPGAQIESVGQLESVVVAMRAIATARAEKGRSLLPGIEAYARVMVGAIGQVLDLLPPDGVAPQRNHLGRRGLIVFCAEQGFAGAFNDRLLVAAASEPAGTEVFLLGTRGTVLAAERGLRATWTAPMATNTEAIGDVVNRLAETLYGRISSNGLSRVDILYARSAVAAGIEIDRRSLLPVDFTRFPHPAETRRALTNLLPSLLLERLTAEYIYTQLCRAAMLAFEAENEARMLAMTAARTNIQAKLEELRHAERQHRQQKTTAEILELTTGASALRQMERRGHRGT
jgi:F-type H+-transporting ATPase subunit gamma